MVEHDDAPSLDEQLDAVGSLQEPVRRALYLYVASERDDVSRDQAAEAVGIQRSLAAFHLDKLVEAGLLETTFRRLTGRTGPGAGRPARRARRWSLRGGQHHHRKTPGSTLSRRLLREKNQQGQS